MRIEQWNDLAMTESGSVEEALDNADVVLQALRELLGMMRHEDEDVAAQIDEAVTQLLDAYADLSVKLDVHDESDFQ